MTDSARPASRSGSSRVQLMTDIKGDAGFIRGYTSSMAKNLPEVEDRARRIIEAVEDLDALDTSRSEPGPWQPMIQNVMMAMVEPGEYICAFLPNGDKVCMQVPPLPTERPDVTKGD